MRRIYIDELPVRCIKEVTRFFRKNGKGHLAVAYKEKSEKNRMVWQVQFIKADELKGLNESGRYLVERSLQLELPFEVI